MVLKKERGCLSRGKRKKKGHRLACFFGRRKGKTDIRIARLHSSEEGEEGEGGDLH